jgi:3-mercaptopyruvate sulfurtransferase SseA
VARKTAGRLGQLLDGVQAEGWRFVALTRLVPLVPLNLLNSALGLTGRIPGARNLPLGELARAPQGLAGHPIVLVCTTDKRSARAAEVLRGAGLRDVRILRGGMVQWQRDAAGAGAPTPMRARP